MYISIDVGGTNSRVAAAQSLDNPKFTEEPLKRPTVNDYETDLNLLVSAALELAKGERVEAVGFGAPGIIEKDKDTIGWMENVLSWKGRTVATDLSGRLGCPIYLDNDAVAMGLGEAYFGECEGDFDYLIWVRV